MVSMKKGIHSRAFMKSSQQQDIFRENPSVKTVMTELLDRRWTLTSPESKIHKISLLNIEAQHRGEHSLGVTFSNDTLPTLGLNVMETQKRDPFFYIVRDDLLHPLTNGNKARKLDALIPLVEDHSATDVVTCGGCQSAHAAAVAVSCAERGLRSHLLLRGEQPDIPTGYNLISTMYGNTIYIPRSVYGKREEMLFKHADVVAGNNGCVICFDDILFAMQKNQEGTHMPKEAMPISQNHQRKVVVVNEGAGDAAALLGVIRLVEYLSQPQLFGRDQPIKIVVDSGTGTTAVGLALGAVCLGLPWEVIAVMLADTVEGYIKHEKRLISDFKRLCGLQCVDRALRGMDDGIVNWVERTHPRKFGNVLKGEVESCQQIAQQTGVLLDPIYTLAGWEYATHLCQSEAKEDAEVVMLHTGGTLGMFGLAQRYKSYFHMLNGSMPISKQ
ncbi:D-cysteine desulfhydrase 2 protein [Thalictrum thalictroides]|uniref:D-cysteine desulfhydrase n=1 Tax=Thalictrum thalictroides TaxID=46969 RepID=A0A7J6URN3_THATH|nr:D-cysteine desulfhydrase 2 protein [Thalictrum thalictroides]